VVLGPYGAGTSAVAAMAAALGANPHPPFATLTDPRTPVSGESVALRQIVLPAFDHARLARTGTPPWFLARLRLWAGPGLSVAKIPALAFFLDDLQRAWDVRALCVRRDRAAIEATRARRGWPVQYGAAGAAKIEAAIAAGLGPGTPRLALDFEALRTDPQGAGAEIAAFLDLPPDALAARRAIRSERG